MNHYVLTLPHSARILSQTKQSYKLGQPDGTKLTIKKEKHQNYQVGDIVGLRNHRIQKLLVRQHIVSKSVNQTMKDYREVRQEQILATNVDEIFILLAMDQNFSLAKAECYLLVFGQAKIPMTLLLTKSDLDANVGEFFKEIKSLYPHINCQILSIYDETSIQKLRNQLRPQTFNLFIGASGAGKSSLINLLMGEERQLVNQVRRDGKGRHTTTSSKILYCQGTYLIDTPGFKGIDTHHEVNPSLIFEDILILARDCKFSNCQHKTEPKCAVKATLEDGQLSPQIWESYQYHQQKIEKMK